jgi:hypothetical protein
MEAREEVRAMRNLRFRRGVTATAVLLLVLVLLLLASSATASARARARPFHGTLYGTVAFVPSDNPNPPYMDTISNATGTLSHMGLTTLYARHPSAMDFAGDQTLTAANGDTILVHYYGGGDMPSTPGVWYDLWTVATITGGTGRFAHVTGDIEFLPSLQFMGLGVSPWPAIFTFDGRIKY